MNDHPTPVSKWSFLGLVAVALVVAWLPLLHVPFDWAETFFHEISHGLAALVTGGGIVRIELHLDGSGLCYTAGGWRPVVSFAGYAGAVVWGALLYLAVGAAGRGAAQAIAVMLGVLVLIAGVLWARDFVTLFILAVILALVAFAHRAGRYRLTGFALRFIALYVMLSATRAPLQLIGAHGLSDGHTLATLTYVPEIVWVLVWEALALAGLWFVFRRGRAA